MRRSIDLESQEKIERYKAALEQIRSKLNVNVHLSPPNAVRLNVIALGPAKGGEDALVTIVEFSDFQCPFCRQAANTLDSIVKSYGNRLRLVYKHLPLPMHPQAFQAAQASVCADKQGKFWQYHDSLFSANVDISLAYLQKIAVEIGLNVEQFSFCLNSDSARETVVRDMQEAQKLKIEATPTFLINGKLVKGALSEDDFRKAINNELRKIDEIKKE